MKKIVWQNIKMTNISRKRRRMTRKSRKHGGFTNTDYIYVVPRSEQRDLGDGRIKFFLTLPPEARLSSFGRGRGYPIEYLPVVVPGLELTYDSFEPLSPVYLQKILQHILHKSPIGLRKNDMVRYILTHIRLE
jgi:hypothetical protein